MTAEDLNLSDLQELREATVFSYAAGHYPENMSAKLKRFTTPDGGLINLIDLLIHYRYVDRWHHGEK